MKKILITGATGFFGLQLARLLAQHEVELILVVRSGKEQYVASLAGVRQIISTPDLFAEGEAWWYQTCQDVDILIHAAWYAEPGKYLTSTQNMDCLLGSLNLAKGAVRAGVKRIVGIGTCFEYDLTGGVLSTETPLRPITPYASAKASLFMGLSQWLATQSVEFAWCRLFYLYGEGEDERRLVPYIRKQLSLGLPAELSSGQQIRDFLDVKEAAAKITQAALGSQVGAINICSGIPITVRQLAEKIASEFDRNELLLFGARPDNLVDPPCVLGIPNLDESTEK